GPGLKVHLENLFLYRTKTRVPLTSNRNFPYEIINSLEMAKKKETKNKDKAADPFSSEDPASGAAKTPESSGEVKGPMGVGGRKKSGSGAVIKKPAKNMKSGARDLSGGKQEET